MVWQEIRCPTLVTATGRCQLELLCSTASSVVVLSQFWTKSGYTLAHIKEYSLRSGFSTANQINFDLQLSDLQSVR